VSGPRDRFRGRRAVGWNADAAAGLSAAPPKLPHINHVFIILVSL
jgi:hypothetical protein